VKHLQIEIGKLGHIIEGEISEVWPHQIGMANAAMNVIVNNLLSTFQNNWNTDGAKALAQTSTVYGPDINGFYYDFVQLTPGFTLKIGDNAYYADRTAAVIIATPADAVTLNVLPGHSVVAGDTIYFFDDSGVERMRFVDSVTDISITIGNTLDPVNTPVTVTSGNILDYKTSKVFGNVAIIFGDQISTNTLSVVPGFTLQMGDIVDFIDSSGNAQRRNVTAITFSTITVDQIPVNVSDGYLVSSENQRSNAVTLQRLNANGATFNAADPISNNLRINIYRTYEGESFADNGVQLYLVASIPNDSSGPGLQTYIDGIPDSELGIIFDDPDLAPNPPPISKYLRAFGNQMFYAGGQVGNADNSDRVFFSTVSSGEIAVPNPESVPLATNFFNVPNVDDDVTGLGVAGSTLVTTKNHSLSAAILDSSFLLFSLLLLCAPNIIIPLFEK